MFQLPFLDREPHEGRYYAKSGRRLLHDAVCGRAEDISVSARERLPDQYAGKTSIAITYFGAAYWAIGQHQAMVDSNSLLFFYLAMNFAIAKSACQSVDRRSS